MNISEHFDIREFVGPETFEKWGSKSIDLFDPKLIDIAEFLRTDIGKPVTINNWHIGGQYHESGLRSPETKTGAKLSAHKIGKAIDPKVKDYDGERWYAYVKSNAKKLYELGLRRIEDRKIATTWCHMDTKEHGEPNTIYIIDLTKVTEKIKF